jgi:hypothetical protein
MHGFKLHGKEAESEARVGGKPILRVSLQWFLTGPATRRVFARIERASSIPDLLLSAAALEDLT